MTWRSAERSFERFRRTGDPAALGDVFDEVAPEALRVARWLAPRGTEPEDLVQRTFLTAIEAAPGWDPSRRVVPWLLGILANHAREVARAARRSVDPARLPAHEACGPGDAAERREAADAADAALDGLDGPARSVLVLRFRHGLEPAEIAHVLRMRAGTVRSHLHRGLERLRRAVPSGFAARGAIPAAPAPAAALARVRRVVVERAQAAGPELAAATASAAPVASLSARTVAAVAAVALVGGTAALVAPWTRSREPPPSPPLAVALAPATSAPEPPSLATADPRAGDEPAPAAAPAVGAPAGVAQASPADVAPDPGMPSERVAIDVTVVDDRGRSVPGAQARAVWGEATATPSTTDRDGRCRLEAAPGSRCIEVFGVAPDPADPREYSLVTYAPLDPGQRTARVVVPTSVRARGRVEDEQGEPVAGATLRAVRAGAPVGFGTSREDGSFELAFPAGEPVDVVFDGDERADAAPLNVQAPQQQGGNLWVWSRQSRISKIRTTERRGILRHVSAEDSGLVLVVAPVRLDGVLVVRALDSDGRPVPGVSVNAPWGTLTKSTRFALTDESGLARVEGVPVWPCHAVLFPTRGDWAQQDLFGVVADGPEVVVTLRHVGARVRGRVVGPDGRPLAGAWIGAYDKAGVAAAFGTDAEGRFDAPANRPEGSPLQLTARHPMESPTMRGHAVVRAGVDEPDVRLVPLPTPSASGVVYELGRSAFLDPTSAPAR